MSKSIKLGKIMSLHRNRQTLSEKCNKAEIAESESLQPIVNQAVNQAATAVIFVLKDRDMGCRAATNTASLRDSWRQRHGHPSSIKSVIQLELLGVLNY